MATDILIIIVVGAGLVIGYMKGAIGQLATVAGLACGIIGARVFGGRVAAFFNSIASDESADYAVAYAIVFVACYLLGWVAVKVLRKAVHRVGLGIVDRLAGAALHGAVYALLLSLALNVYADIKGQPLAGASRPITKAETELAPMVLGYIEEHRNL